MPRAFVAVNAHPHALGDQPADGDGVRPAARIEGRARSIGSEFRAGQRSACDARASTSTKRRPARAFNAFSPSELGRPCASGAPKWHERANKWPQRARRCTWGQPISPLPARGLAARATLPAGVQEGRGGFCGLKVPLLPPTRGRHRGAPQDPSLAAAPYRGLRPAPTVGMSPLAPPPMISLPTIQTPVGTYSCVIAFLELPNALVSTAAR